MRSLICYVGPTGSGKTTQALLYVQQESGHNRPLFCGPGTVMRQIIGAEKMSQMDNPTAPIIAEPMVRSVVDAALRASMDPDVDVVLDGFPRTDDQFQWLVEAAERSEFTAIDIRFLTAVPEILLNRVKNRSLANNDPDDLKLATARLQTEVGYFEGLYQKWRMDLITPNKRKVGVTVVQCRNMSKCEPGTFAASKHAMEGTMLELMVKYDSEEARNRCPLKYAKAGDCGLDLYNASADSITIPPGESKQVPAGVRVKIPDGFFALLLGRSSTFHRRGLMVVHSIIDSGYTGPLFAHVWNPGLNGRDRPVVVEPWERLAQLVIAPFLPVWIKSVESLPDTERGESGFGSTGA